jgi:hypothetical protein
VGPGIADSITPYFAIEYLGRIAARRGDRRKAEQAMRALPAEYELNEHQTTTGYVAIAALLGDADLAMRRLNEVSPWPVSLFRVHRDPDFSNLLAYPRFVELMTPR